MLNAEVYTIEAGFGDVTLPLVLWLMQPRDSRDHLIGLPHVRFVVHRAFRPVGFFTIRFCLKLLHILMALNNKKVLCFLQLQHIVTARNTKARVLQLIVGRTRKTWVGNFEQLELGGKRKERLTLTDACGVQRTTDVGRNFNKTVIVHLVFLCWSFAVNWPHSLWAGKTQSA
jgi:hypothetical protein